jgi:hypothetical protein
MPDSNHISTSDLLEGYIADVAKKLPRIGSASEQVVVDVPADISASVLNGVTGLFALAPFRCRGSARGIRDLYLSYDSSIDEGTASCFPGIANLRLESNRPVRLSWFGDAPIEALAIRDRSIDLWAEVGGMSLRYLNVNWSGVPLEDLPFSVVTLILSPRFKVLPTALAPVFRLPRVENLAVHNIELRNLRALSEMKQLANLVVSTKSLSGVARLIRLRSLRVVGVTCPPISELGECTELRSLELRARRAPEDLSAVTKCGNLERLVLDFGALYDVVEIKSLNFLRTLKNLQELTIQSVRLLDKDLSAIQMLPQLKRLKLVGNFGSNIEQFEAWLQSRSGMSAEVQNLRPVAGKGLSLKPVMMGDAWTLLDDLTLPLNLPNNYEVEKAVKAAIEAESHEVLERIEFDSESGAFSAQARSRRDIGVVAKIIRAMIAKARHRPPSRGVGKRALRRR